MNRRGLEPQTRRLGVLCNEGSEAITPRLTPKQHRFVTEYLVDLNATQAAIRAGYSPKTAPQQGSRLLRNAVVQQAIAVPES